MDLFVDLIKYTVNSKIFTVNETAEYRKKKIVILLLKRS